MGTCEKPLRKCSKWSRHETVEIQLIRKILGGQVDACGVASALSDQHYYSSLSLDLSMSCTRPNCLAYNYNMVDTVTKPEKTSYTSPMKDQHCVIILPEH